MRTRIGSKHISRNQTDFNENERTKEHSEDHFLSSHLNILFFNFLSFALAGCLRRVHTLVQFDERFNIYKEQRESALSLLVAILCFVEEKRIRDEHRRGKRKRGRERERERRGHSDTALAGYY